MNSRLVATECGQKGKLRGRKSKVGVTQRAGIMVPCSGTCRLFLCKAWRHVEKWNAWIDDLGTGWRWVVCL